MSDLVSGHEGTGEVVVYTTGPNERSVLETLSFTVDTSAVVGVHAIRVILAADTIGILARLDDLNEGGPSQTNFYTYGLGLNASACTVASGMAVTDALPETELPPGSSITIEPINASGTLISGDAISGVLMLMSRRGAVAEPPADTFALGLLPGVPA